MPNLHGIVIYMAKAGVIMKGVLEANLVGMPPRIPDARPPSFIVNGPADYSGIAYLDSGEGIYVDFTLVPEPSTYALMLGGLGLLVVLRLRTRRTL